MNDLKDMDAFHLDVLREISNIGAGNAATALSTLLQKKVDMKVSRVIPMQFNEITEYVGGAENIVATVFSRIDGDISGNMLFVIGEDNAKGLVDDLTGKTGDGQLSDLALSVLQEIGNILAGSYLTALADFTGFELQTNVPSLAIDMAGAMLSFGLMEIGRSGDWAIMIDAEIHTEEETGTDDIAADTEKNKGENMDKGGKGKSGHIFLLPDPESFEKIFIALGVHRYGSN
ncbi:CheY-P-specific phosphatase CheC [Heliobacillus mobilis]|uniref:CheY-P-specific phosphatase CheC n=1 Tax=Heliobacterium mobile TaxID=28064 RepID=A0A6I3SBI4_HELMO|nr:chemotaxis protein CheC [Heliobacterium mobile]MTV47463.1 CheY-P-specific phosphatase CheC [Heliobacterium mobile]